MDNEPLTEKEKSELSDLLKGANQPPPDSFIKLVEAMKMQQLISSPRPLLTWSPVGILSALLVAAVIFFGGYSVGQVLRPQKSAQTLAIQTDKARFVLLVRNDDTPASDPKQQVTEYSNWLKSIRAERIANGEHLFNEGYMLSKVAQTVETRPLEDCDLNGNCGIGGYFFFEADSADEAKTIAQSCPHLNYGGSLELRQLR
jgi:hypothetical protein